MAKNYYVVRAKKEISNPIIIAPSGRKLYRHESDMGTVMEYTDSNNATKKVLVLDPDYYKLKMFGAITVVPTGLTDYYSGSSPTLVLTNATDEDINTIVPVDNKTSKENCDVWMTYNSKDYTYTDLDKVQQTVTGVPAVAHCRSILVDGTPCDLPNVQILARIYADRQEFAKFVPKFSSALSKWDFSAAASLMGGSVASDSYDEMWSSTYSKFQIGGETQHQSNFSVNDNSTYANVISVRQRWFPYIVIPILELD